MAASTSSTTSDLPITVTQHDPTSSIVALKGVTIGNLNAVLARTDVSHGPFECEVKEHERVDGDCRTFVIVSNRAVDVVNTSSETVRVSMEVSDACKLDYLINPGGYLRGLYGGCAISTSGTTINFGNVSFGKTMHW